MLSAISLATHKYSLPEGRLRLGTLRSHITYTGHDLLPSDRTAGPPSIRHRRDLHKPGGMPVSGWQTVLISASLAASCLGVSGQGIDVQLQRSHLLFLKSSPAGEPFNLELVVRRATPCSADQINPR